MAKVKMNLQMFGTKTPVDPTTTNTHVSANFGKLLEPGLRKIFFETYDEVPEQFSKVYNVETSNSATETDYGMGAFGDWTERADELAVVDYAKISEAGEVVYRHKAFTKGFMISREMYDAANTFVNNFLTNVLQDAYNRHWEMVDISVNINSFHIDLIWED